MDHNSEDNSPIKVYTIDDICGIKTDRITKIQRLEFKEYQELVGYGAPIRIERAPFWFKFYVADRQENAIRGTEKRYFYKDYTSRGTRKE